VTHKQEWEYEQQHFYTVSVSDYELKSRAKEGWELVAVLPYVIGEANMANFIWKRRINDNGK